MMNANASVVHPELKFLVSEFCALECCPPAVRDALSSLLMTGDVKALYEFRISWRRESEGVNMYWTDVLDFVSDFQAILARNATLTEYAAERLTFRPLRRLLKTIPRMLGEICHE